jgi:outer membrane protease
MIALQIVAGLMASAALGGMICRLEAMTWRTHQAAVIIMHMGLALGCLWAIHDAIRGEVSLGTVGAIVTAWGWMVVSLETWKHGPPVHTRRLTT